MSIQERASALAAARELRKSQSSTERLLWQCLRDRRLAGLKFRRQMPIGKYIVDFACLRHRLVVELDGMTHLDPLRDQQRDDWLRTQGFRVLHFWNSDVWKRRGEVLADIVFEAGKRSVAR